MKFLRNKRADHSLRDAQYGHLVGKILGDRELVGLLTAVLGYRYGTKTGRVPRGEQHRREIVTCWSRKCEQMEICPTLLKLLKTRYPGKKLEMLGACDFKCVLVDGKPVLLLPLEYDAKPFFIHIGTDVLVVSADAVETRQDVRICKTGNGLAVVGTTFCAHLAETNSNGAFATT